MNSEPRAREPSWKARHWPGQTLPVSGTFVCEKEKKPSLELVRVKILIHLDVAWQFHAEEKFWGNANI